MVERNTHMKDGELIPVPLAADAVIETGKIAVADGNGYGAAGSAATGLTYLGRAEQSVDNTGGANGDKTVMVRRKKAFLWKNSGTDAVTQASQGKVCYIEDDETVAATDGTGTLSPAGIVIGLDGAGVWVE